MTKYKPEEESSFISFTRNKCGDRKEHLHVLRNGCIQYTCSDSRSFSTGEVKDITKINTQEARFIIKKLIDTIDNMSKQKLGD